MPLILGPNESRGMDPAKGGRPGGSGAVIGIFALLSLVPVIALGIGLGNVVSSGVQAQNLAEANRNATLLAQAAIEPLLVPADLAAGLSDARLAELDQSLRGIAFGKAVARLKIWNRQNIVVYSDNRALVGRAFPADEHLTMSLAGATASEISSATSPENRADTLSGTFLSVYVPLYFDSNPGLPAGAFELYLPWAPVAAQIQQESQRLYLMLAIGLGLLYLSLLPVLLIAERWRRGLAKSLEAGEDERRRGEETARVSELKSAFLAAMSHEMRTPLNAVLGYAQLLRGPGLIALDPRQDKYVQNIARAGRHLLALTNDVLDLSKIEAGRMELEIAELDLAPMVAEAVDIIGPLADAKLLSLTVRGCELMVKADALRLTQVLMNLLSNAVKFTPAEGAIRVTAERSGPWIEIRVADSGAGIAPEEQAAVFERYIQAGDRSRHDGTGLGLPLSRRLIELMAGELDLVDSSPLGSTFRIRVPAATARRAASAPSSRKPRRLRVPPPAAAATAIKS